MKKNKLIMAFMALLSFSEAMAQQGEILYTDLDPDPFLHVVMSYEQLCLDLNFDTVPDMCMSYYLAHLWAEFTVRRTQDNLMLCCGLNDDDVIADVEDWQTSWCFYGNPYSFSNMGFRYEIDGDYYYGWFRTYSDLSVRKWYFDKYAYCTIPNYPLRWGQTDIVGVEENEPHRIAKLHPNPTTDLVRIEGVKCAEVQVYNALGQHVKTDQNTNEVSLVGLPQGVYLLHVTLENGKVFSEKVVKE